MTGFVRTVLGDVEPQELLAVNYHEHLFQESPLLVGDELNDEHRSLHEAQLLRTSGFDAFVDATPVGLGRRPDATARISRSSGLHIVMSSGAHRSDHYGQDHPLRELTESQLAALFERDLTRGVGENAESEMSIRAGVLKAGIGYWAIDEFEHRVVAAAARVHGATGAPLMVHLEHGSAAHEVLDLLASHSVSARDVALAHIDRNPDAYLHIELAARGAYLGYDGFGRSRTWPDSLLIDCMIAVIEAGYADRVLIGGDVARRRRYISYGGMPGLQYLGNRVLPRLVRAVGQPILEQLLTNAQSWLAWGRAPSS